MNIPNISESQIKLEHDYKVVRVLAVAFIVFIASIGGCVSNTNYQERHIVETSIKAGFSPVEALCAINTDSVSRSPTCIVLASKK